MSVKLKLIWIDMILIWVVGISIYVLNLNQEAVVSLGESVALFLLLGLLNGIWVGYNDWQQQKLKKKSDKVTKNGYTLQGKGLKRYSIFRTSLRYSVLIILQLFLAWACEIIHNYMDDRSADWTQCLINIACTLGAMLLVKLVFWLFTKDN